MAVDSSIIFIERIKDNYKNNLKEAFEKGSHSSLSAIIDANVTTLIIAVYCIKSNMSTSDALEISEYKRK